MKTIIQTAKEEVKKFGQYRKELKPLLVKIYRLQSKKLRETEEYKALQNQLMNLYKDFSYHSIEPRYIYLAYAKIRGKDWNPLEKYPDKVNEKIVDLVVKIITEKHEGVKNDYKKFCMAKY